MYLSKNAQITLDKRYRQKTPDGKFTESYEDIFRRVANNVASVEATPKLQKFWADAFYKEMTSLRWMPNTPTICNAGTNNGLAYNACYVWGIEDTIISDKMGSYLKRGEITFDTSPFGITDAVTACALITKTGGGIGYTLDRLRPTGDWIETSKSESGGPIGFWHVLAAMSGAMQQGGKRRGANMMTMSLWHPDILKFITAKDEHDPWMTEVLGYPARRFGNFNISVKIRDAEMKMILDSPLEPFIVTNPRTGIKYYIPKSVNIKNYQLSDLLKVSNENVAEKSSEKEILVYSYRNIWEMIIERAHNHADPGVIFWDRVDERRVLPLEIPIETTNPCITGDTLVAVADGRGNISIKQLAEEGVDVPVFCLNDNGKIVVRKMRNPRITGYNEKLLEIEIENGHKIRCTPNHKLMINGRSYIEAKNLKIGDSLFIMNRNIAKFREVSHALKHGPAGDYIWISTSDIATKKAEHRIIYESLINKIPKGHIIHHKDYNSLNNDIDNLACMSSEEHSALHAKDMIGDKNPMRRAKHEWSQEKWEEYSKNMSNAVSGLNNGRAYNISNFEIRKFALELTKKLGRRFSSDEWQIEAEKLGIPTQFSKFRSDELGTPFELSNWASLTCGFEGSDLHIKILKSLKNAQFQGYKTRIQNEVVLIERICEHCKNIYEIPFKKREQSYCSIECSIEHVPYEKRILGLEKAKKTFQNRKELLRNKQLEVYRILNNPNKKEWIKACKDKNISFEISRKSSPFRTWNNLKDAAKNHKIISIREIEPQNVYNGTVDDYHNFFIGGFEETPKFGTKEYLYINNRQCGEQALEPGGVCNLGSIDLSKFWNHDSRDMDWNSLQQSWASLIRFLDNVIDATPYPMQTIKESAQSWRRIGPGIMGLADLLFKAEIPYNSEAAFSLCEAIGKFLYKIALYTSISIGQEKGFYPGDPKATRRNSYLTTIAPTGTISIISDCSASLEPLYALVLKREVMRDHKGVAAATEVEVNPYFTSYLQNHFVFQDQDSFIDTSMINYIIDFAATNKGSIAKLDAQEMFDSLKFNTLGISTLEHFSKQVDKLKSIFVTALDIPWIDHVTMQSTWTKHFTPPNGGNSISKTNNLPNDATTEDVKNYYIEAWMQKCIGTTMYRDGSHIGQPMSGSTKENTNKEDNTNDNSTVDTLSSESFSDLVSMSNNPAIGEFDKKDAIIVKTGTAMGNLRLVVGFDNERKPIESYVIASKQGTDVSSMCDALGRTISLALQGGVPVNKITQSIKNISGGSASMFNGITIKSIPDGIAQMLESASTPVIKTVPKKTVIQKDQTVKHTGDLCPECSGPLVYAEGCRGGKCLNCDYSKC